MQALKQTHLERKADAHKKIKLGGLIIKAGLDHFFHDNPSILYGMLLYNKQIISSHPQIIDKWKQLGTKLFNPKLPK